MSTLLDPHVCRPGDVAEVLRRYHYLGPTDRGFAWSDEFGVAVLAAPSSRRLPPAWLELTRWCLSGEKNGGSRQWARIARWLRIHRADVTTVVSYSDPGAGHTGALYRASGWLWAPTWHRLRPPPSGNGRWSALRIEAVKDRWVYPLRPDAERAGILRVRDEALMRRNPEWEYREPRIRRGRVVRGTGGGDYAAWRTPDA